jgi:hypothetical protein
VNMLGELSRMPAHLKVNPLIRVRIEFPVVVELPLEGKTYEFLDSMILALLASVETEIATSEVISRAAALLGGDRDRAEATIAQLHQRSILVADDYSVPRQSDAMRWIQYGWTDALIYHLACERQAYDDVVADEDATSDYLRPLIEAGEVELWKSYPQEYWKLPRPGDLPNRELEEVLLARRSHKPWRSESASAEELSRVLVDANSELVKNRTLAEQSMETDPSLLLSNYLGALETYVVIYAVDGWLPGIYHYSPKGHSLAMISDGDKRSLVVSAFSGQKPAGGGSFSLIISSRWLRQFQRYGGNVRSYRNTV